jgi:hypothetical protein
MKRCSYCGGPLGLIVRRKWSLRFCSKACKQAYEYKQAEAARLEKQYWRPPLEAWFRCAPADRRANDKTRSSQSNDQAWKSLWLKLFSTIHH